jgi:hypothetical protein
MRLSAVCGHGGERTLVLTDTMYVVRGPDGERRVCRPCMERCGFRRHDEGEDWESLTNAGAF